MACFYFVGSITDLSGLMVPSIFRVEPVSCFLCLLSHRFTLSSCHIWDFPGPRACVCVRVCVCPPLKDACQSTPTLHDTPPPSCSDRRTFFLCFMVFNFLLVCFLNAPPAVRLWPGCPMFFIVTYHHSNRTQRWVTQLWLLGEKSLFFSSDLGFSQLVVVIKCHNSVSNYVQPQQTVSVWLTDGMNDRSKRLKGKKINYC